MLYEEQGITRGGGGGGGDDGEGEIDKAIGNVLGGPDGGGGEGDGDWLKQVMTGGGLKAPGGGLYLDLDDTGGKPDVYVPSTVQGRAFYTHTPQLRASTPLCFTGHRPMKSTHFSR